MNTEDILIEHGIRPTAIRTLVYRAIGDIGYAFSLSDLETMLDTLDRSTIFRTLTLMEKHHLLHSIDDGSGQRKYCHCISSDAQHADCQHVHIFCRKCGHTYCLKSQQIPNVTLPEGFAIEHINYIITGICASCHQ